MFCSLFFISFKNSSPNFNKEILHLVFDFVNFVGSVAVSASVSGSVVVFFLPLNNNSKILNNK